MKILEDCFGNKVRLTDERLGHILDHPEMQAMEQEIEWVMHKPQFVRRSRSDEAVRLFYAFYARHWWVASGCALWLSTSRTMPL